MEKITCPVCSSKSGSVVCPVCEGRGTRVLDSSGAKDKCLCCNGSKFLVCNGCGGKGTIAAPVIE